MYIMLLFSIHNSNKKQRETANNKRRMHRSMKIFRRPFWKSDSNSDEDDMRSGSKTVHFGVICI